ncbi:MAG TPA: DUF3560 domain-containing protein [Methylobacter sp.]
MLLTATYSPEDNKLRLYSTARLEKELYLRVRSAGFIHAPKQDLFVAPMWTPGREDLLHELCGEIDDEDKSLVDRAEERADRFEGYQSNRLSDAESARNSVAAIADNIPFGQPILVGHHSERRARKDAERIENGMRKAVKAWDTAEYWERRAAGALAHAKYKELPAVRQRRIKKLEADMRKQQRNKAEAAKILELYETFQNEEDPKAKEYATNLVTRMLRSYAGGLSHEGQSKFDRQELTFDDALKYAKASKRGIINHADRWISHYSNRINYETAMLAEVGGIVSDRVPLVKGGGVKCWASHRGGWSWIVKVNKVTVTVYDNWGNGGGNFTRNIPFDKLSSIMTPQQVEEKRNAGELIEFADKTGFSLRAPSTPTEADHGDKTEPTPAPVETTPTTTPATSPDLAQQIEALRAAVKTGVQVVAAPQLFETSDMLAEEMIDIADIQPGMSICEPSAGTGKILRRIMQAANGSTIRTAVEINSHLCAILRRIDPGAHVFNTDFLTFPESSATVQKYDRIIMNPPFANAIDIQHIKHAHGLLAENGKVIAICAAGPRQRAALQALIDECGGYWKDLPAGSFKESGTAVNTALVVIHAQTI